MTTYINLHVCPKIQNHYKKLLHLSVETGHACGNILQTIYHFVFSIDFYLTMNDVNILQNLS